MRPISASWVLVLLAALCFLLAAFSVPVPALNLMAAGLFLYALSHLVV